jgi:hypothetical protein
MECSAEIIDTSYIRDSRQNGNWRFEFFLGLGQRDPGSQEPDHGVA